MGSKFYSFAPICAYSAKFNMAVGGRGIGKTYGWQKMVISKAIKTYLKNKEQSEVDMFIYLRRYKDEISMARATFFAAVGHEFPDWDFKANGYQALMAPASTRDEKKRKWITIGYFIELSRAQLYKSVAFPQVKDIGYDEFILEKGHQRYLQNEVHVFLNFFNTVDRPGSRPDGSTKTRVFFLANSVSITNPYMLEWDVNPNNADKRGFVRVDNEFIKGFVIVQFIDSTNFANEVYQTDFGKFIKGTDYANFAVENEFADNHDGLLQEKNSRARYLFTLETNAGTFSIWMDIITGQYFCQGKRPKGDETIVTLLADRMDENKTFMRNSDSAIARLRTAYNHGRVWFDRAPTRNAFLEIYRGI